MGTYARELDLSPIPSADQVLAAEVEEERKAAALLMPVAEHELVVSQWRQRLEAAMARLAAFERGGFVGPTGPVGFVGAMSHGDPTGPIGATGPTGPTGFSGWSGILADAPIARVESRPRGENFGQLNTLLGQIAAAPTPGAQQEDPSVSWWRRSLAALRGATT